MVFRWIFSLVVRNDRIDTELSKKGAGIARKIVEEKSIKNPLELSSK